MTFPSTVLDLKVELDLNGTWTDISTYVYQDDTHARPVITRGHPDESTTTNPSVATMALNNRDGRFSPKNPTGPYYGNFGRNTPIRISVDEGASYLRSEVDQVSYASTPDSVGLSITGDTEIQIDLTLDNWNSQQILASKWVGTGGQRSWILLINENGTLQFEWSPDGTNAAALTAVSTQSISVPALGRQAIKVTLAVASGTVSFYTAANISGSWTQLGSSVVLGAANVFDSTAMVTVGWNTTFTVNGYLGKIHAFKLLSGIGGTVKASPDFTSQTPGITSFNDAQSNTWTLNGTTEISNRKYRFHGEISSIDQVWDQSGTDVYTPIEASGVLRRLSVATPIDSAMFRYWTNLTSSAPIAYWPCEDSSGSGSFASGLSGGQSMNFSGNPTLSTDNSFICSDSLPAVNGSTWVGRVNGFTNTGTVVVRFLFNPSSTLTAIGSCDIMKIDTSGPLGSIFLSSLSVGGFQLSSSTSGLLISSLNYSAGVPVMMSVELVNSGGNVIPTINYMSVNGAITTGTTAGVAGTIGSVLQVTVNPDPVAMGATIIGHIAVQNSLVALSTVASPLAAYAGEAAGDRFSRLCGEEGITFRGKGNLDDTVLMGPQTQQNLATLLQECVDSDRGIMFEPRQTLGLGYRTRVSLQNQATAISLSYSGAQLSGTLEPTEDDQNTTNDVTVTRSSGGSSSRQVLTTGALSIQSPPNGVGSYPTSDTLNLFEDSELANEAGWILHIGTVNEPRYPVISVDLSRTEVNSIIHNLEDLDMGDKLVVTSPPSWLPPDAISQVIYGSTETLGGFIYTIDWNGVPESPYDVIVVSDTTYGFVDTDSSSLHAGATSTGTSFTVDTLSGFNYPSWTTSGGDFPFDINVSGERVTVTNITGPPANWLTGQNTGFEGGIGTWTARSNCSVADTAAQAHTGSDSLQMTSTASGDMQAISAMGVNGLPVVPGDVVTISGWFRAAVSARSVKCRAYWWDSSGNGISNVPIGSATDSTSAWTQVSATATAPANAAYVSAAAHVVATGAANEVHYFDDVQMSIANSQIFTVTRSVNGVVKAQTAGTDVRLFIPPIISI